MIHITVKSGETCSPIFLYGGTDKDYGVRFISSDNAFLYLDVSLYRINAVSLLLSDINSGKFLADSLVTK